MYEASYPFDGGDGVTDSADETFTGTAGTLLTAAPSNYVQQTWIAGSPNRYYPVPLLDGNGNIWADVSGAQPEGANFIGFGTAVHKAQLKDDCWAEVVYRRSVSTSANCQVWARFPWPEVDSQYGYRAQQGGTPAAPNLRVYKGFNTQLPGSPFAVPAATNGVDHTMRIECQRNVVRVLIDGATIVNYTDPSPWHVADGSSRTGVQIDVSSSGIQADVVIRRHSAGPL